MLKRASLLGAAMSFGLLLTGCTPTLDTSSQEAMEKSVAAMTKDMTAEQRVELQKAMMVITASAMGNGMKSGGMLLGAAKIEDAIKDLHGMTVDEIIAKAKSIKK